MDELRRRLEEHRADPFPTSVEKGTNYGAVDPVMIDADIYGWALQAVDGRFLGDRAALRRARDDLQSALEAFPAAARPYYARLVEIASAVLE